MKKMLCILVLSIIRIYKELSIYFKTEKREYFSGEKNFKILFSQWDMIM